MLETSAIKVVKPFSAKFSEMIAEATALQSQYSEAKLR
jgi:hypothetical protein